MAELLHFSEFVVIMYCCLYDRPSRLIAWVGIVIVQKLSNVSMYYLSESFPSEHNKEQRRYNIEELSILITIFMLRCIASSLTNCCFKIFILVSWEWPHFLLSEGFKYCYFVDLWTSVFDRRWNFVYVLFFLLIIITLVYLRVQWQNELLTTSGNLINKGLESISINAYL